MKKLSTVYKARWDIRVVESLEKLLSDLNSFSDDQNALVCCETLDNFTEGGDCASSSRPRNRETVRFFARPNFEQVDLVRGHRGVRFVSHVTDSLQRCQVPQHEPAANRGPV